MNDKKRKHEIQDSTTDFFLKVIQKEKDNAHKDTTTKENINITKTKTIDTVGRFYNYINQTLDKILSNRMSVMLLSLIMAIALFVSISGGDILTSPTSGTTLENVPIKIEGLDDAYELSGVPESVQVGLIGPSLDIYTARISKDYQVYIDLKGLSRGEHTVSLNTRNFPDTLTVMLVPDTLKIKLLPKVSATFDLGYRFINEDQMDQKYSVSVKDMAISSVNIRASQETLNRIVKVEACIDVSEKTEDFSQDAVIKAYDSNNKVIDVEIAPTTVHVSCDVDSYSKTVPVKVNFVGDLPEGYQISKYTLSQDDVRIYGAKENIDKITSVMVDINVDRLKQSTVFNNHSLKKETGINKFSTDTISVTVEVDKVISKTFDNIPIKVLNNSSKNKVSFAGKGQYASVNVIGSEDKISALTVDNIQATIDVNNLSLGTKKVSVKVAVDDDSLQVKLLSSSKVTINIERK